MKNRLIAILIAFLTFLAVHWVTTPVFAENIYSYYPKYGDYNYEEYDHSIKIINYSGKSKNITIPSEINGKPVTEIEYQAFSNKGLTNVVIPSSVKKIGSNAFSENKLTKITIPKSVTEIEFHAFASNQLKSITIPSNLVKLESGAFYNNKLTNVTIQEGITKIEDNVFSNNQLTSVTIPNSVKEIEGWAFQYNHLTEVTIPKNVKTIGSYAFFGNELKKVVFKGTPTVHKTAFDYQIPDTFFHGWYTDKTYKKKWNNSVKSPMTIFGKWESLLSTKNITIKNNINQDTIKFKNLKDEYTYTIYKDSKLTQKLTSFTATFQDTYREKTLTFKQIGGKAGALYIVVSRRDDYKSKPIKFNYQAEPTPALSSNNINVKYGKKQSTIQLKGLTKGAKYIIYKDEKKKGKIASFTASGKTKNIKTKALNKKVPEIYVEAKKTGYKVSSLTTINYAVPPLYRKNVKVKYGKKQSTIQLKGVTKGIKYTIYKDAKMKQKVASFTSNGKTKKIKTKKLTKKSGKLYIKAQKSGYKEVVTTINYPKGEYKYQLTQINISFENGNSKFIAGNLDYENLGEFLSNTEETTLKRTKEGTILYSIYDSLGKKTYKNNKNKKWFVFSKSCGKNYVCPQNVDNIKHNKEKDFIFYYLSENELDEFIEFLKTDLK